jgi:hypothetical protein
VKQGHVIAFAVKCRACGRYETFAVSQVERGTEVGQFTGREALWMNEIRRRGA